MVPIFLRVPEYFLCWLSQSCKIKWNWEKREGRKDTFFDLFF